MANSSDKAYEVYKKLCNSYKATLGELQLPNFSVVEDVLKIIHIYDSALYEKIKIEQRDELEELKNKRKEKITATKTFLRRNVQGMGLSKKVENILIENGIVIINDLARLTEMELLRLPDFGRKGLEEVIKFLEKNGLILGIDYLNNPKQLEDVLFIS